MSELTAQTAELITLLPEDEVALVNALVKKLIRAWDPDFTKVTAGEREALDAADADFARGIYFTDHDVWDE